MNNKKRIVSFALFLTLACTALVGSAQDSDEARELKAAMDKYYGMDFDDIRRGGEVRSIDVCFGTFTVDYVYPVGDPHLKEETDQFAILGPFANIYVVWPMSDLSDWDHSWRPGMYVGTPSIYDGWYTLKPVGVEPHGMEPDRDHEYIMKPNDEYCPTYFWFHSLYHVDEGPIRHPGHAGAGID